MRSNKLIQFYLTNICNSKCRTCNIWQNHEPKELDINEVLEIIWQNPEADFVFGGGEPLLYQNIDHLLWLIRGHEVKYTLLSNCLLPVDLFNYIKLYKVPNVTISFDGSHHNFIRRVPGNIEKIEGFLNTCKDNWFDVKNTNIKLSYTLSKYNQDSFLSDMDLIKYKYGFDKVYLCLAHEMDLLQNHDDVKPYYENISKALKRKDMFYEKDLLFLESLISNEYKPVHKCDSNTSVFTIYNNGDVVRCQSYLSNDVIGNIYNKSFNEIIKDIKQIDCPHDEKCLLLCQRRYDGGESCNGRI